MDKTYSIRGNTSVETKKEKKADQLIYLNFGVLSNIPLWVVGGAYIVSTYSVWSMEEDSPPEWLIYQRL